MSYFPLLAHYDEFSGAPSQFFRAPCLQCATTIAHCMDQEYLCQVCDQVYKPSKLVQLFLFKDTYNEEENIHLRVGNGKL